MFGRLLITVAELAVHDNAHNKNMALLDILWRCGWSC
jgi:hypothetical protein